jgi:hypothetical protein
MRWIQASLTLVVLLFGLALTNAGAAEEPPAPTDAATEVAHNGLLGADFQPTPIPSFNLAEPFDSLFRVLPLLADAPYNGLSPSLDSLIPALSFLVQDHPPVSAICQRRCPAGWPVTASVRLTWLQRFLF